MSSTQIKRREFLTILGVYVVPILVIGTDIVPIAFKTAFLISFHYIVFATSALIILIDAVVTRPYTAISFFGNWKSSLRYNSVLSIVIIGVGFILYTTQSYPVIPPDEFRGIPSAEFIIFYVLLSVPIQQWLVFGDLRRRISVLIAAPYLRVILMALVYMCMHLYYPDNMLILLSTLIMGLIWGSIVEATNSVVGNLPTHIFFGLIAFALNFA